MIAGLDHPDSGRLLVDHVDITKKRDLTVYRAQKIGFVFQLHNLMPAQTALENVMLPMFEGAVPRRQRKTRARELLGLVGLGDRAHARPPQLSGGERQHVAIARALANYPKIILADEPTGSLDSQSSAMIMDLLAEVRKKENQTLITVTHEEDIGERAERVIRVLDGRIESSGG